MNKMCSGGCGIEFDERQLDADDMCDLCASIHSLKHTLQKQGKIRFYGEQQQLGIHHNQPKEKE